MMTDVERLREEGLTHVNRKLFGNRVHEGFSNIIETDGYDFWYIYDYTVWLEEQVLELKKRLDID